MTVLIDRLTFVAMTTRKARSAAAEAARLLLQDRIEAVAEIAEAGTHVDAAAAAVAEAEKTLHDARAEYRVKYTAALTLGWSAEQLAQTGCSAERGDDATRRRGRRRRADPPAPTPTPAHAQAPAATPAAAAPPPAPDATDWVDDGPPTPADDATMPRAS